MKWHFINIWLKSCAPVTQGASNIINLQKQHSQTPNWSIKKKVPGCHSLFLPTLYKHVGCCRMRLHRLLEGPDHLLFFLWRTQSSRGKNQRWIDITSRHCSSFTVSMPQTPSAALPPQSQCQRRKPKHHPSECLSECAAADKNTQHTDISGRINVRPFFNKNV